MDFENSQQLVKEWASLLDAMKQKTGQKPTLEILLFLVGVQELGKPEPSFSKSDKEDLMNLGTFRILSYWGYYKSHGKSLEGWPLWKPENDLPYLDLASQNKLIRLGLIRYFREQGFEF